MVESINLGCTKKLSEPQISDIMKKLKNDYEQNGNAAYYEKYQENLPQSQSDLEEIPASDQNRLEESMQKLIIEDSKNEQESSMLSF